MSIRSVTKFPEKVLLNKTASVKKIDEGLKALIKDMLDTMYLNDGVGLSANQVGVDIRIAVMNPTGKSGGEIVMINPEITKMEGTASVEEGCLSMPGVSAEVKRALKIEVKFQDMEGRRVRLALEGLPARIVQHELDHLNGHLFIDRVPLLKRKGLVMKYNKLKRS